MDWAVFMGIVAVIANDNRKVTHSDREKWTHPVDRRNREKHESRGVGVPSGFVSLFGPRRGRSGSHCATYAVFASLFFTLQAFGQAQTLPVELVNETVVSQTV
jgi:hypothetical protein